MIALAEAREVARFGGKAAGLARAIAASLPVPDGVALEHTVVDAAMRDEEHRHALARAIASALPGPLAIRSSAVGEDGHDASFAGQHATRLNAASVPAIARSIVEVAASARTPSALAYRAKLGLPRDARMAIVAQRLVRAELAGVLFTKNPSTGADERVVEAARGLGETVVQGLVTPEHVRVARDGRVLEHRAGRQDLVVMPTAHGEGTEEREVEPTRELLLDPIRIARLGELAARAEAHLGGPLDLEWAFEGETLFLLQARRVTR